MKRSRIVAWLLVFMMAFTLVPSNTLQVEAAKKQVKVKKVTLNKKNYTLKKGKKVTLKATLTPKNTTQKKLVWSTSNKKVATVSAKGVVSAKKNGKATITVKVKGTSKKAKCKIVVGTPVKKVSLNISKKELKVGESVQLTATLSPKKPSVKGVTYTSSDATVAAVSSNGKVTAKKAGTATITATAKDGTGKKATCTVTVKAATVRASKVTLDQSSAELYLNSKPLQLKATVAPSNATNKGVTWSSQNTKVATVSATGVVTPVATGTTKITVKTSDGGHTAQCTVTVVDGAVATTSEEILNILEGDVAYSTILLKTDVDGEIVITANKGSVDWSNTTLKIDAPNATVQNDITFGEVEILAIKEDTYIENANNTIIIIAPHSHIIINESARATIVVEKDVEHMELDHHGYMNQMTIHTDGEIQIKGETAQAQIPTIVDGKATIYTAKSLEITASEKTSLVLQAGSEGTRVKVKEDSHIPEVEGLGSVKVITDSDEQTVVAKPTDKDTGAVTIEALTGIVADVDEAPVEDAKVYLLPYDSDFELSEFTGATEQYVNTGEDGTYRIENITAGNYFLVVRKEGYRDVLQTCVFANSAAVVNNEKITMTPVVEDMQNGSVSGIIVNSVDGAALEGMTVRIRSGNNNLSGATYKEDVLTDARGYYQFTDVEPGTYTIQVVDLRQDAELKYVSASFNVHVRAGEETADSGTGLSPEIEHEQVRFVLTWGNEASGASRDLDSHIVGPTVDDSGLFHVYYSDQQYYGYIDGESTRMTDLDLDDVTWEGPETVTIYEKTPGVYYYLIHDFTNLDATYSMYLANSQAKVEVYMGNYLVQSFYVPNQEGTLWTVCSYNSMTNTITPINTMSYETEPSAVGTDSIYGNLKVTSIETNEYITGAYIGASWIGLDVTRVAMETVFDHIVPTIAEAGATYTIKVDENGDYKLILTGTDGTKRQYNLDIRLDYGDLRVTGFQINESVTDYYIDDGSHIGLYVTSRDLDAIKEQIIPTIPEAGASYELVGDDGEWCLVLTGADGWVRKYQLNISFDWGELCIKSITCSEDDIVSNVWVGESSIEIAGVERDFADVKEKLTVRYGADVVDAEWQEDEDGDWYLVLTDAQGACRTYWVDYWFDVAAYYGELCVEELYSNNGVVVGYTDIYSYGIEIEGRAESFADVKDQVVLELGRDVVSYEWVYDDAEGMWTLVISDEEGTTRTYDVYYYYYDDDSVLASISAPNLTYCRFEYYEEDGGYIWLRGLDDNSLAIKDSLQVELTDPEGTYEWFYSIGNDMEEWTLQVTDSEGNTYTYTVYYGWDEDAYYGDLCVEEVLCANGLMTDYDIDLNYITIYGPISSVDEVADSLEFVLGKEGVTYSLAFDEYEYEWLLTLTDEENGQTRDYYVGYSSAYGQLYIEDATSTSDDVTDIEVWSQAIEIWGIAENVEAIKESISFAVGNDVESYAWVMDEYGYWQVVITRADGVERTYNVIYYFDEDAYYADLCVTEVFCSNGLMTSYYVGEDHITIYGPINSVDEVADSLEFVLGKEGVTYTLVFDENEYEWILTLTDEESGLTREYCIYYSTDYGELCIDDASSTSDSVTDIEVSWDQITIYGTAESVEEVQDSIEFECGTDVASWEWFYHTYYEGYGQWEIILTRADGVQRTYWVYYEFDEDAYYGELCVTSITCSNNLMTQYYIYSSDIDIYGPIGSGAEIADYLTFVPAKEGVDVVFAVDEESGEWMLTLTDEASGLTREYYVYFTMDYGNLYIEDATFTSDSVLDMYVSWSYIDIYSTTESVEEIKDEITFTFGADVESCEWIEDEYGNWDVVITRADGVKRTYDVYIMLASTEVGESVEVG